MKRLYSILLMAFFSLYLMSFTNIISNNSDIHVDVTNETGTFSIERDTIGHFTYPQYMSYSYTVSSTPNIKCLSYQHYGVYNIYTIATDSYGDTEIYIYNDMCGLIGYDNDSLNINEDSNNYNAYLYEPIGDDELVYIVCRAKNFYYNNNVELSLSRWN